MLIIKLKKSSWKNTRHSDFVSKETGASSFHPCSLFVSSKVNATLHVITKEVRVANNTSYY